MSASKEASAAAPTDPDNAGAPSPCANCGTAVASNFCPKCGQRVGHAIHSLWHFTLEAAEDLTHADSRLWRTMLALLFKPGYLTAEFLAGRRMSYLPPLRLYLVLSVLFFLVTGLLNRHPTIWMVAVQGDKVALEQPPKAAPLPGENAHEMAERVCARMDYHGPWRERLLSTFRAGCEKSVEDKGRGLTEAFTHNIPRAIFFAVPLLALVMKPLYRRPRRYYVEHLLFLLHDHAFAFLLFGLFAIATRALQIHLLVETLVIAVTLYVPYYYYSAMRRVYGQGPWRTVGKLVVLSFAYLVTAIFVLVATSIYSVLAQ